MRLSTTSILEPYSFAHPSQIVTAIIVMIRLFPPSSFHCKLCRSNETNQLISITKTQVLSTRISPGIHISPPQKHRLFDDKHVKPRLLIITIVCITLHFPTIPTARVRLAFMYRYPPRLDVNLSCPYEGLYKLALNIDWHNHSHLAAKNRSWRRPTVSQTFLSPSRTASSNLFTPSSQANPIKPHLEFAYTTQPTTASIPSSPAFLPSDLSSAPIDCAAVLVAFNKRTESAASSYRP
jgi:hypothetical protein